MGFLDQLTDTLKNPFSQSISASPAAKDDEMFSISEVGSEQAGPTQDGGALRKSGRTIHLRGNRLPKDKLGVGTKQRLQKNYYPGHRVPTVQVLGGTDEDVILQGQLNDKYLPKGALGEARAMREVLQDICSRGTMVLLQWASYRKYAFLEHVEFEIHRENMADYKLTFSIYGNAPDAPVRAEKLVSNLGSQLAEARTLGDGIRDRKIPAMKQGLDSLLSGYIDSVAEPMAQAFDLVDAVTGDLKAIASNYAKLTGLIKNVNVKLRKIEIQAMQISTSLMQSTGNVADLWSNFSGTKRTASDSRALRYILTTLLVHLASVVQQVPVGRHRVSAGDTLQKIAFKFYQDSTQWKKIKVHNGLSSDELTPGQVLEIPR